MISKHCQVPNFCRQDSMFVCAAANDIESQKRCRFYRKATRTVRCMYCRSALDGHCDNTEAQHAAKYSDIHQN